ncbi:PREDICTED: uncharacterized protein LOC104819191 [Tarenaya hassleriana]|uniref:uncharacterized protein LOC104819191 n=1 Tax=Tarenaya hassleriana TaxID=28532 RepID=UPI00053C6C3B|nr:PREDICTED: uncharacterized protein LOC104819191 [Tarenaya hassleriana]
MGFGAIRAIVRPLSRSLVSRAVSSCSTTPFRAASPAVKPEFSCVFGGSTLPNSLWIPVVNHLHSLTDTRHPKRRPMFNPKRKRASLKPPGPYAWVQYVPGQPISPNNPNEGSTKRRNEKKRMRLRRAFILAEKKKRKAQMQEANRKKKIKQVERKMAAVARERAWSERLAELQRLEEEKKKSMAS